MVFSLKLTTSCCPHSCYFTVDKTTYCLSIHVPRPSVHLSLYTIDEVQWRRHVLDLSIFAHVLIWLFCGNDSTIYLGVSPIFHNCSEHIKLDYHFGCEMVGCWYCKFDSILHISGGCYYNQRTSIIDIYKI